MINSLSVLEKMHNDNANMFASNIIEKYKNRLDNLHSICLADFAFSYVCKKASNLQWNLKKSEAALFQYLLLMMLILIQI